MLAKTLRILTVPPVLAAIASTVLLLYGTVSPIHYIILLLTLTVLPTLAYPLSLLWPPHDRRRRQRNLALVLSVSGYVAGALFALLAGAPRPELVFYMTYVLSGIATAGLTFALHIKSSGHACGTAGPAVFLGLYVHPAFFCLLLLLIPVFWASLKTKRHTLSQLSIGAATPIVGLLLAGILIH